MRWLLRPSRLVLVLATLAIAVVPALRREFVWNVRALLIAMPHWPSSEYAECILSGEAAGIRPDDPEAELDSYPRDLELRIALARDHWGTSSTIRKRALEEALRLAPEDRVVLSLNALNDLRAGKLRFDREEGLAISRENRKEWQKWIGPHWREKLLTAEQISGPLKALDRWAAADPDNAAPGVFAAYLLLGARADKEALGRAEKAAGKQYLTLHDLEISGAAVHAQSLRGALAMDAENAALPVTTTATLYAQIRLFARIMSRIGWRHYQRGEKETAFRYWTATGRIGTLMMSSEREYVIPRLVGTAVQDIGYSRIYMRAFKGHDRRPGAVGEIRPGPAYDSFVALRGTAAAKHIHDELSANLSLFRDFHSLFSLTSDQQLGLASHYFFGRRLAAATTPAMLFAVLLCLTTVFAVRRPQPTLGRLWKLGLVLLAILVPEGLFSASAALDMLRSSRLGPAAARWPLLPLPDSPWFALAISTGPALLLMILLAIAAAWVAKKKQIRYRTCLGGATRQTLPGVLAILAVIWIASATVAAREGAVFADYMARQRQVGELRILEEFAADRGIPVKPESK